MGIIKIKTSADRQRKQTQSMDTDDTLRKNKEEGEDTKGYRMEYPPSQPLSDETQTFGHSEFWVG
ncbi:MAG: hypothetical protein LBS09_00405 [Bacteroidales bacterium]|jgi:hypothetical protein|nr:hypothetical protein [Bacteroidales bacterium]